MSAAPHILAILSRLDSFGARIAQRPDGTWKLVGPLDRLPAGLVQEVRDHRDTLIGEIARQAREDAIAETAAMAARPGVPSEWCEGLAVLTTMPPPRDVPPGSWRGIVDAAGRFIDTWGAKAAGLGWDALSVFGCDGTKPYDRIDRQGLIWLLNSCEVVAITADTARVRSNGGKIQTYYRRPRPGAVAAWELQPATQPRASNG